MKITETERKVLEYLAAGFQSKEIAIAIGRSKSTVEAHIRTLYIKLDSRSRAQLIAEAMRSGLVSTERRERIAP